MDKNVQSNVKEVCEKHKCVTVYVVSDGQIFLPTALNHAKNHAIKSQLILQEVDSNGEVLVEDVLRPGNKVKKMVPNTGKSSRNNSEEGKNIEKPLKDQTMGQLRAKVTEVAAQKGVEPIASTKKQPLIDFIETTLKLDDKKQETPNNTSDHSNEAGDPGANGEGGSQNENTSSQESNDSEEGEKSEPVESIEGSQSEGASE